MRNFIDYNTIVEGLKSYGVEVGYLISGSFGYLVHALEMRGKNKKWWEKLLGYVGGAAVANYMTPLVVEFGELAIGRDLDRIKFGVCFNIGYIGMKGIEKMLEETVKYIQKLKAGKK